MNIEYVGRHYSIDDQMRSYAEDKLAKVLKFVDEPIDVRLTMETEKHRAIAELHLAHRHGVLQATEETEEMIDAVNLVVDKVEKQARRSRKKFIDKRRRADRVNGSHHWPVDVLDHTTVSDDGGPRIIKSSHLQIKPMSLDEAALVLETSRNDFVVFRDAGSDRVNVLYRRKDSNYGLITPEA